MSLKIAKIICRIIGTLAGLVGVVYLFFSGYFLLGLLNKPEHVGFGIIFFCFFFALTAYFLFVGWLVWFRFSPSAVRHTLFIAAIVLWSSLPRSLEQHLGQSAFAFMCLGSLIVVCFACRWLSRKIIVRVFPESLESGTCI